MLEEISYKMIKKKIYKKAHHDFFEKEYEESNEYNVTELLQGIW